MIHLDAAVVKSENWVRLQNRAKIDVFFHMERNEPREFFANPQRGRLKDFLSEVPQTNFKNQGLIGLGPINP